ncbi:TPA: DUF1187 family protein, partial [Bacillus thuringiensis]|nr:DUF1187 family protein [Bacillus thuringiensis]
MQLRNFVTLCIKRRIKTPFNFTKNSNIKTKKSSCRKNKFFILQKEKKSGKNRLYPFLP